MQNRQKQSLQSTPDQCGAAKQDDWCAKDNSKLWNLTK